MSSTVGSPLTTNFVCEQQGLERILQLPVLEVKVSQLPQIAEGCVVIGHFELLALTCPNHLDSRLEVGSKFKIRFCQ